MQRCLHKMWRTNRTISTTIKRLRTTNVLLKDRNKRQQEDVTKAHKIIDAARELLSEFGD